MIHVFSAFLPQKDPSDRDFYSVLEVETNCTTEQVRKAYKVKSLKYHPDKVAQRRDMDAETAQAEYTLIQEAYECLHNPQNRQVYNQLGKSPTRYRFVQSQHGLYHPVALYENLASASCIDKTRLLAVVCVFLLLLLLQPILIAAKVNQLNGGTLQDTSWMLILIPLWIFHASIILILLALTVFVRSKTLAFKFAEHACWFSGEIVLALVWDGSLPVTNWHVISVPFYLGLFFRILASFQTASRITREQAKMVSPQHLPTLRKENEDEDAFLSRVEEEYHVVTVDPSDVLEAMSILAPEQTLSDEEMEFLRVSLSPEYQALQSMVSHEYRVILNMIVFCVPFVPLVASKLQGQIDVSWWVVFVPILVYLCGKVFFSCCVCVCMPVTGNPQLVVTEDEKEEGDKDGKESGEGEKAVEEAREGGGDKDGKQANGKADPLKASTNWATAEGSMKDFNGESEQKEGSGDGKAATENSEPINNENEEASTTPAKTKTSTPEEKKNDNNDKATGGNGDGSTSDGADNDETPHIDEETFNAWQKAQAEAENSAMEKQAKAQGACCLASFQLIIVCLIVGKLQEDYGQEVLTGYSSFWILFPVFLVLGVVLCCCCCLIYGAGGDSSLDSLVERAKKHGDDKGEEEAVDEEEGAGGVVPLAAPAPVAEEKETEKTNTSAPITSEANGQDAPDTVGEDMNELD